MNIFKKLMCSIIFCMCFLSISTVSASNTTDDTKIRIIDSLNKGWIFEFSDEINPMTINSNNVYIKDKDGRILDLTLSTASYMNDSNVLIIYPNEPYKNHCLYTLHIDRNLESIYNESLSKPINIVFKVVLSKESISYWAKKNIKDGLIKGNVYIDLENFNLKYQDVRRIIDNILNESPEIIHYNYDKIYFDPATDLVKKIKIYYTKSESTRDREIKKLNERIKLITNNQKTTNEDRIQIISSLYNIVLNNTVCSLDKKGSSTAYSVLIDGQASCSGYAKAFQLLMNSLGYETDLMLGYYKEQPHMWVKVKLYDIWYHFDPAADDSNNMPIRQYFMVTDQTILKDHALGTSFNRAYKIYVDSDEKLSYIKNMRIDFDEDDEDDED